MAWLPVRPGFVHLLTRITERLLFLVDDPPVILTLSSRGDDILLYSYLNGGVRPLALWSAENLHIYMLASVALVLAVPLQGWRRRLGFLGLSLAMVTLVAVLICVVQVKSVAGTSAERQLGLILNSPAEKEFLDAASRLLIMVGMHLLPAFLFLVSYISFWGGPSADRMGRVIATSRRRLPAGLGTILTGLVLAVAAGGMTLLASAAPHGPADYLAGLTKVSRLNPASALARCSLGVFYEEGGRFAEAGASYRQALSLDSGLTMAHYGLGNVLFKQGALEEAAEAYQRALASDPTHVSAHLNLGITLFHQKLYADAARSFEEVLRLDPRRAAAHHNLGLALISLDRPCEALPHLERSVALDRAFAVDPAGRAEIARLKLACRPR